MVDVITQIERAMTAQGVTQIELSRRVGHRSHTAISRLLSRKHDPGDELLQAIATALQTRLVIPAVASRAIDPLPIDAGQSATA